MCHYCNRWLVSLGWLLAILLGPRALPCAQAHDLQTNTVRVRLEKDRVVATAIVHGPGAASEAEARQLEREIPGRLRLRVDGAWFVASSSQFQWDGAAHTARWQAVSRGTAQTVRLVSPLYPEKSGPGTLLCVYRSGRLVSEQLVQPTALAPSTELGPSAAGTTPASQEKAKRWPLHLALQFFWTGVLHLLHGPDHLLFLFCLLVPGGNWKRLLKTVTAFTVAHSLTLALATTGILVPPSRLVEPLIAGTLVVVAGRNLWGLGAPRPNGHEGATTDRSWILAFAFGLIHGFGFAGGLLEAGLPLEGLFWVLAGFNLGLEAAQLAVLFCVAPLLAWALGREPKWRRPLVGYGSWGVVCAGTFWAVQRLSSGF